jgi:hypothetical protein
MRSSTTVIDGVMQAFTMMANLTPEEAQATRERLAEYLAGTLTKRRLRLRGFAICADQAVCAAKNGEGPQAPERLEGRIAESRR